MTAVQKFLPLQTAEYGTWQRPFNTTHEGSNLEDLACTWQSDWFAPAATYSIVANWYIDKSVDS